MLASIVALMLNLKSKISSLIPTTALLKEYVNQYGSIPVFAIHKLVHIVAGVIVAAVSFMLVHSIVLSVLLTVMVGLIKEVKVQDEALRMDFYVLDVLVTSLGALVLLLLV